MTIKRINLDNKEIGQTDSELVRLEEASEDMIYILNYFIKKKRFRSVSVKNRSQVACTGAKPYGQKGTGRARRGTNATPLRRGGGVIFGPSPHFVKSKLPKKVIKKAVMNLMSLFKENILILEVEGEIKIKTKDIVKLNGSLKSKSPMYVLKGTELELIKACKNIKGCEIMSPTKLKPELFLKSDKVIFSNHAFDEIVKVNLEQNNDCTN